jgi:hypothetical protein
VSVGVGDGVGVDGVSTWTTSDIDEYSLSRPAAAAWTLYVHAPAPSGAASTNAYVLSDSSVATVLKSASVALLCCSVYVRGPFCGSVDGLHSRPKMPLLGVAEPLLRLGLPGGLGGSAARTMAASVLNAPRPGGAAYACPSGKKCWRRCCRRRRPPTPRPEAEPRRACAPY